MFLLLVIYGSAGVMPEIIPIDLPFGHISHVVTSVCYLLGTILNIKYKFWENLSSRFDLRAVVAIVIFNIHVSCGISPICQGFQHGMCLLNCKQIKQATMAVNSTLFF